MKARAALSGLFVAGLVALALAFRGALADAGSSIAAISAGVSIAAFVAFAAGRGVLAVAAFALAGRRIAGVGAIDGAVVSLRSGVAKYIPGSVWQPMNAVLGLRRAGASPPSAVAVVVVDMAASLVGALVAGAAAVPVLVARDGRTAAWLLLGIPALLVMHPRVFALLLRGIERVRGSAVAVEPPPASLSLAMVGLHAAGWLVAGFSLALLLGAVDPTASTSIAIPAAALSWAAGFVVPLAPAGLGVREVALVALLSQETTTEAAIAVALVSRVLFVVMDLLGAIGSLAVRRRMPAAAG